MKIEIDGNGHLWIERKGKMKQQKCPYFSEYEKSCGDWCPMFGEPYFAKAYLDKGKDVQLEKGDAVTLNLCEHYWEGAENQFTDEREGPDEQ